MIYSFLLNKNFVFRSKAAVRDEVTAFVLVTASGVLFMHNFAYALIIYILERNGGLVTFVADLLGNKLTRDFIIINLSTVVGAVIALAWNYYGYKKFVFTNKEAKEEYEDQHPA